MFKLSQFFLTLSFLMVSAVSFAARQIEVQVFDKNGIPAEGIPVTFEITGEQWGLPNRGGLPIPQKGRYSLFVKVWVTNSAGMARINLDKIRVSDASNMSAEIKIGIVGIDERAGVTQYLSVGDYNDGRPGFKFEGHSPYSMVFGPTNPPSLVKAKAIFMSATELKSDIREAMNLLEQNSLRIPYANQSR